MEILQQMGSLPIFIIMFVIIYFLIIRPQSVQKKDHQSMLENLKKGDRVTTRGGMIGNIVDFKGKSNDILILDIGNNVKVNFLKTYVVSLLKK